MKARKHTGMAGWVLAEMLVCMGITGVVLGLGGIVFAQVIRLKGAQDRYYWRLDASDYLLRRIARDVRSAKSFAASAAEFRAGDTTLILVTDAGKTVYTAGERGVERIELSSGRSHRLVVFDAPGVGVHFDFEGAAADTARATVTTVEWREPPKIGVSRPTLSLRVALRNRR